MNKLVLTTQDPEVKSAVQLFAQANNLTLEVTGENVIALPQSQPAPSESLASLEAKAIENALVTHKGNMSEAAKVLQIGRATLYRKVKEYGLEPRQIRKPKAA